MLLFHICIPFAVEHFRPRATIKNVLFYWFSNVGWALGLSEFLLPAPEEVNGVVANNNEERRQDRANNIFDENQEGAGHVDAAGNRQQIETPSGTAEGNDVSDSEDEHETEEYVSPLVLLAGAIQDCRHF